ncbi:MAG: hypothetical protein FOGNACKC_02408 [Anaerolineae bacterium]|nr:hypothetical protein [Anaerolineae bacterium]
MQKMRNWFFNLNRLLQWAIVLAIIVIVGLSAVTVSATTWEYTNSPEFCGTTCHTMPPEYTAYQVSPHARVDCVDCHLGRQSFLSAVPQKAKEITHVTDALTQSYEPPIYIKNLRPARDTCEKCHNPDKFSNDTFVQIQRYAQDKNNTERTDFLIVKTGGGTAREGLGRGIHWHVENKVQFYSDDPLKQTIPYIRVEDATGQVTEYFDVEAGLPPTFGSQVSDQLHTMDCVDCHNRISHNFRSPSNAMDDALSRHVIDQNIPEIKKRGVELLSANYDTTEEGLAAIDTLTGWYQENYPDFYAGNTDTVEKSVNEIKTLFTETIFPNMAVGWQTHPNNVGHREFPGCFRCHDGKHISASDEAIRLECNLCHSIPEVVTPGGKPPIIEIEKPNEPESHLNSNWIAQHRFKFDTTCMECHDVSNPGGTDDTSFCSNSGCHATEWKFVGLNAPAIREMVAPPRLPGSGEPRQIPHPAGPRTDCTICHGTTDAIIPTPANHEGFDQSLCELCHKPLATDLSSEQTQVEVPQVPHLVDNFKDQCLTCHQSDAVSPFPQNHATWQADTCLFCHQEQTETAEAQEGRPPIPHTIEGREDCLACHGLDSIKPFPENHKSRPVEKCQNCHKPQETKS